MASRREPSRSTSTAERSIVAGVPKIATKAAPKADLPQVFVGDIPFYTMLAVTLGTLL